MEEIQDDVLLDLINSNDEYAFNYIIKKYTPIIKMYVKKEIGGASKLGLEYNDLMQEGLLGLTNAINLYNKEKDNKFSTFAEIVIKRQIKNYIKAMNSNNNLVLNESLSISDELNDNYIKKFSDYSDIPGKDMISKEIDEDIKKKLNTQEYKVYELKKETKSNREIAIILNRDDKTIENTITRINAKIKNMNLELI